MKKFLLSVATVAMFADFTNAEVVTLNVKDATDITGTEYPEVAPGEKDENGQTVTNGKARHVQPVESLVLGDFDFSFVKNGGSTEPAFYYQMSSKPDGACTVRVYKNNTMTISAPADMPIGKIEATDTGNKTVVIYSGDLKTEITYTASASVKFVSFTITVGEAGDDPVTPPTVDGFLYSALGEDDADITAGWEIDVDAEIPEGLNYVWKWKEYNGKHYLNASAYYKQAYAAKAYAVSGDIDLTKATKATLSFDHAAKFQTNLKQDCKAIARVKGDTNWTELTIPTWPAADTWDFSNSGDIDLKDFVGKTIQIGFLYVSTADSADTWEIKNLKIAGETASVANVEMDADEAPVYFNLQGVRVENAENGIFIEVKGGKAVKVIR